MPIRLIIKDDPKSAILVPGNTLGIQMDFNKKSINMKTLTELDCLDCAGTGNCTNNWNEVQTCRKCNGDGLNRDITAKDIANYFIMNRFNNEKHTSTEMYGIMVDIINVLSINMLSQGYEEGINYCQHRLCKTAENLEPSYELPELIKIMIT